ncbi:MAG: ParA family protein [Oceanococcus sp.]
MRRVVFNQKGGVGKTTIVCNLAAISAARGRKTLVLDLDPQCNSSQYLLGSQDKPAPSSIADFFESTLSRSLKQADLEPHIAATPFENLFVVPAHPDLEHLIVKLESRQKIYKLSNALKKLGDFDEIFIDTPPALNFYSRSALIAADRCLIPFDCDDFARQALYTLTENIEEIQADHNESLEIEGIVVNQFQARANLPQRLVKELEAEGMPILKTRLASSIKVKESHDKSIPLVYLDPKHKLSLQFHELFNDLK